MRNKKFQKIVISLILVAFTVPSFILLADLLTSNQRTAVSAVVTENE